MVMLRQGHPEAEPGLSLLDQNTAAVTLLAPQARLRRHLLSGRAALQPLEKEQAAPASSP